MSNVAATFTANISGYTSAMNKMQSATSKATGKISGSASTGGSSFLKMGALVGAGAAVVNKALSAMGSLTSSAVSRFDTLNNANRTFKNMGFSTKDTKNAMDALNKSIMGLPTSLDAAVQGTELMAAATGDVGEGQKVFSAVNDAVLGFGGSAAQASSATQQLSQDLASGTITASTWNSMINDGMGPALKALAKTMGMTAPQLKNALSSGKVSAQQFQTALINLDKNGGGGMKSLHKIALDSTDGIGTSFTNLKTAVVRGMANMLTVANNFVTKVTGTSISGWIKNAASAITDGMVAASNAMTAAIPAVSSIWNTLKSMISWVVSNKDWLVPLTVGIVSFIATVKTITTVIAVFNALKKAILALQILTALISDFKLFRVALASMAAESKIAAAAQAVLNAVMDANIFVIIIAAIVAVVAALVYFFTQTKTGQAIWQSFTSFLSSAWTSIVSLGKSLWNGLASFLSGLWNSVVSGAIGIWTGLSSFFSGLWTGIVSTATSLWSSFTTTLSGIWSGVVAVASSVWSVLTSFFSTLWNGIISVALGLWNTFGSSITTIWNGIVQIASSVWGLIKAAIMGPVLLVLDLVVGNFTQLGSDVTLIWNQIVQAATTLWNGIKNVINGVVSFIVSYGQATWSAFSSFIVNIWNSIISTGQSLWNGFKSFMSSLWNGIKSTTMNVWSYLTSAIPNAINTIKSIGISLWNSFNSSVSNIWNSLRSTVINAGNSIINGIHSAWNGVVSWASGLWNGVKSAIRSALNFNLWDAGKAIMDSFLKGLRSVWGSITSFVGNIASWIREHKGPISYDKKLLIPAGQAIMGGFNRSLQSAFNEVQSNVSSMASQLANTVADSTAAVNAGELSYSTTSDVAIQPIDSSEQKNSNIYVSNEIVGDRIYTSVKTNEARKTNLSSLKLGGS